MTRFCRRFGVYFIPVGLALLAMMYNTHKELSTPRMKYPDPSQLAQETSGTGLYFTRPSDGKLLEYHHMFDEGQYKERMVVLMHDVQVTGNHWCKYKAENTRHQMRQDGGFNTTLMCPIFPGTSYLTRFDLSLAFSYALTMYSFFRLCSHQPEPECKNVFANTLQRLELFIS